MIEEFLEGEEASVLAFTDGITVVPMVPSQDHKAALDGDLGPNTGGMGAFAPAPIITEALDRRIHDEILLPLVRGLERQDGILYSGILYAGLMIDKNGDPKVVEFNVRFGDPETQVILPLLYTDLLEIFHGICHYTLCNVSIRWKDSAAACVVLASDGYPGEYKTGRKIKGLKDVQSDNQYVVH